MPRVPAGIPQTQDYTRPGAPYPLAPPGIRSADINRALPADPTRPRRQGPSDDTRPRVDAINGEARDESRKDRESEDDTEKDADGDRREEPEPPEVLSAFERQLAEYGDPEVGQEIRQFGYDILSRLKPVDTDIPVGPDYVLGTGDSIVISLWGSVDLDYIVELDRQGEVRLPELGRVPLKSLTLERAVQVLRQRFDESLRNYQLDVRVGRVRDMHVHVVGRVVQPGRVRLSSVASLFDALAAASGITKDGTLRRIVVRRQGQPDRTLDLYAYLLQGDITVDASLAPNDVVFVPAVGPRVAIAGHVLRPAIYELSSEQVGFDGVLQMAGSYSRLADRRTVQIESVTDRGLSLRTVDLSSTPPAQLNLSDGDVVVVRRTAPQLRNVVYVTGNVSTPGRYALQENMRVSDLLTHEVLMKAGFWLDRSPPNAVTPDADNPNQELEDYPEPFLEYALIRRIDPRTKQERRIAFHLGKAILDRSPAEDHLLQAQDTIVVFPREDFEEPEEVFIYGAVQKPSFISTAQQKATDRFPSFGELTSGGATPDDPPTLDAAERLRAELQGAGGYRFFPGMRVQDLIRMAGGLKPEAFRETAILTRVHPDTTGARFEHVQIDLRAVSDGDPDANVLLQPSDTLCIKVVPEYRRLLRVEISGEVLHPGTYSMIPGERLSDLIQRAGGFTEHSYLPAVQFYRESVRLLQQERLNESLRRLELEADIAIQRFVSEATAAGEETDLKTERSRIDKLITSIRALPAKGRMVIRLHDRASFAGGPNDLELTDGDRLVIPRRAQEVNVVGAVFNQNAILYENGQSAREYLFKCGGATDNADMEIAFVIRADGSADSAQSTRRGYHWDPTRGRYTRGSLLSAPLYPGDTLVIPYDVKPRLSALGLTKTITQLMFQTIVATGVIVAVT